MVALNNRNRPPNSMIRSRPEKDFSNTSNRGSVSVTIHEMLASRPRRINSARVRPMTRARSRCSGGNLSARMAINTRLSMPSTNSSTIKVSRPSQAVGSAIHSIMLTRALEGLGMMRMLRPGRSSGRQWPQEIQHRQASARHGMYRSGWKRWRDEINDQQQRLKTNGLLTESSNWEAPSGCSYKPLVNWGCNPTAQSEFSE